MSFEEKIKNWVSLDNQIKQLNEKIKIIRDERNNTEQKILNYAETNNLSNSIIRIADGKLKFTNTKQTNPITFKYIEDCLTKCIKNEEQIKYIMNYIKESRQYKNIPDIKRFYNKK